MCVTTGSQLQTAQLWKHIEGSAKLGLSYAVSTALNKFSESQKDCALFFLHVCIDKIPPRGPPTFHAWVLFFSKTESVLVLFNPYEEHLDNLPVVSKWNVQTSQTKGKEQRQHWMPSTTRISEDGWIQLCFALCQVCTCFGAQNKSSVV